MMLENLNFKPLTCAIATLKVALDEYKKDKNNDFVRDACIQRFEYCYDLSSKMIKRYLTLVLANPSEVQTMTFQNQIREAYTLGIIENSWDKWWEHRDNRNKTSHGYDENIAIEIANDLDAFYQEVEYLLKTLMNQNEA